MLEAPTGKMVMLRCWKLLDPFGDEINHLPFGDLAVWWCLVCLFKMVVFHS